MSYEIDRLEGEFRRATELIGFDPATTAKICERIMAQENDPSGLASKWFRKRITEVRGLHRKAQKALRKAAPVPPQQKPARPAVVKASPTRNQVRSELGLQERKEFEKRHRMAKGLASRNPEQAIGICDSTLQELEGRSGTKTLRDLFLRVRAEALVCHRRRRR